MEDDFSELIIPSYFICISPSPGIISIYKSLLQSNKTEWTSLQSHDTFPLVVHHPFRVNLDNNFNFDVGITFINIFLKTFYLYFLRYVTMFSGWCWS